VIYSQKYLIRETHADMFGHVNNATYLEILEDVRWDLITLNGYGIAEIRKLGKGPVILECQIKFLKELRPREEVSVTVEDATFQGKIGTLNQKILKADGSLACEAKIVFGLFDLQARKLVEPTPEWRKALGLD
jgi:thioesterase III